MKIFALNLCLEFSVTDPQRRYDIPPMPFSDLMAHFFKGTSFPGQVFYLEVGDHGILGDHLFELQANPLFRDIPATIHCLFPSHASRERFLTQWKDRFKPIDAAGGLVENEHGEFLCIFNRDKWTLPKGRVEWKEPVETAALREVMEETGLREIKLEKALCQTFHTFRLGGKWVLKTTHWYTMKASSEQLLTPQLEEGIEAVAWLSKQQWLQVADKTYPLIRHLFEQVFSNPLTNP